MCVFLVKSLNVARDKYHTWVICCVWSKSRAKHRSSRILSLLGLREKSFDISDVEKKLFFFTVRVTKQ